MPRLIRRVLALALSSFLAACATVPTGVTKNTSKTFNTVVVDAGHGGKDSGAYRRYGGVEKIATLDVARRLEQKLHESQLKTVMTRSTDDFLRRGIHGFETYYHFANAAELANRIQAKLMAIPHSANRGVHTANFHVLRLATYPAVLVECGFLSNRREGGEARDAEYRELLAYRIAEAII